MYWNVPRIVPCAVSGVVIVGGAVIAGPDTTTDVPAAAILARPKSSSFTPAGVTITLPGFRSRCRMPWRCAAFSAPAIWIAHVSAWPTGIGPFAIRAASVSPSRYSITRNEVPPVSPTSNRVQMCA